MSLSTRLLQTGKVMIITDQLIVHAITHSLLFAEVANFEYGVQTYEEILQNNLFFVPHMKLFKKPPGKCLFLCRPKRHGKTLLCSLAECLYDAVNKPHFDKMFSGVDASLFTPPPCSFTVLPLSFGGLQPSDVTSPDCGPVFERNFQDRLRKDLTKFCEKYGLGFPISPSEDAIGMFEKVVDMVEALSNPVSVMNLIDV